MLALTNTSYIISNLSYNRRSQSKPPVVGVGKGGCRYWLDWLTAKLASGVLKDPFGAMGLKRLNRHRPWLGFSVTVRETVSASFAPVGSVSFGSGKGRRLDRFDGGDCGKIAENNRGAQR